MGLVAGGMADGVVNIWDPAKLGVRCFPPAATQSSENDVLFCCGATTLPREQDAEADNGLVTRIDKKNSGAVSSLQFNPHPSSQHLFATGSSYVD